MHCVFCFCSYGWFLASVIALVDIETEPVFLAAAVDSVLGILGDGVGDKENRSAVRIHRARTPTLCSPARQPEASACGADVAPILRPQSPPRASGWLPEESPLSGTRTRGFRDARGPDSSGRASSSAGAAEPLRLSLAEPRPVSPATVGGPRAPRSSGCGPRWARGLGRSAAPGTGAPAQPLPLGRGILPPAPPSTLHQSEGICGR